MFSLKMLLSALTLTLLALTGGSKSDWVSKPGKVEYCYPECSREIEDIPGLRDLRDFPVFRDLDVYYSPVVRAEKVVRPLRSLRYAYGPISHSGVRVTLEDGSRWLIHKGENNGADSQMVVSSAENMSSKWKTEETRELNGTKTVADFVKAGGDAYDVRRANCHHATDAMMNLCT